MNCLIMTTTTTSPCTKRGWESALHVAKYGTDRLDVRVSKAQQQSGWLFTAISTLDGDTAQSKCSRTSWKNRACRPAPLETTMTRMYVLIELKLSLIMTVWMMSSNKLGKKGLCIGHPIIQTLKNQDEVWNPDWSTSHTRQKATAWTRFRTNFANYAHHWDRLDNSYWDGTFVIVWVRTLNINGIPICKWNKF